jgi:hypothetical protein
MHRSKGIYIKPEREMIRPSIGKFRQGLDDLHVECNIASIPPPE